MKLRSLFAICLIVLAYGNTVLSRTLLKFTDQTKPATIALPSAGIFTNSDSLSINQRLLSRDIDYQIHLDTRSLDLSSITLNSGDTLTISFHEIPEWAAKGYGRVIPDASLPQTIVPVPVDLSSSTGKGSFAKDLRISGAKTFRFSSRTEGEADFGQSLDLRINGEISPGLELSGALTDRGYDPSYGTSTSRLNELDKLNLQLKSKRLLAQIGDIAMPRGSAGSNKNVSGASFQLAYPAWQMQAAAARPKGRFQSNRLIGEDRFQGPYRMGGAEATSPVVPGSESVWLDGQQLERGADKDYTVDYPTGQITFTARHPIDRRSRIEVDFEPLATSYRQELLTIGGGVSLHDSLLSVSASVYREGDDRNQLILGDLSDADRLRLAEGGDGDITSPGVTPDTAGDYLLAVDSLADTVWNFVGAGNGEYRITFSFVGSGKGSYRYVGGQSYQYVGSLNGDYLPVRKIPRPERTDHYQSLIALKTKAGRLSADIRQSSHDSNMSSSLDDGDNDGLFYQIEYLKDWVWHDKPGFLTLTRRLREPHFSSQERLVDPDFNREYLLPSNWVMQRDEIVHSATGAVNPISSIRITPRYSRLTYGSQFESDLGSIGLEYRPVKRITLNTNYHVVTADLDTNGFAAEGKGTGILSTAKYSFNSNYAASVLFEKDSRRNGYSASETGLRFDRWELSAGSLSESIRYERYMEDSLETVWSPSGTRDRISATASRQFANLGLQAEVGWQQLDDRTSRTSNFLGRTSLSYTNSRQRLQTQTSYLISNELRNERGISYLEVEPGRGNYSFEEGRYIPDPFGNFIQVEELLSDRASVRRGEKSFLINKDLSVASIRFSSNIREELLESGERKFWWIIPFLSDESQPYLLFSRRYDGELRLLPWKNFYAVNLTATDDLEKRTVSGSSNRRRDSRGSLTLKQAAGNYLTEQSVELFRSERDSYYIGAGSSRGFRGTGILRRTSARLEWNGGTTYRSAKSTDDDKAELIAVLLGIKLKAVGKGEIRTDLELYNQSLDIRSSNYSYELTDNHNGKQGGIWTIGLRYGIRPGVQANINFTGRHSDDRPGRVSGRGEVVATF